MPYLRQSTAQVFRFGPFLDATDGVTEETALTITPALRRLSKDGGAFAAASGAVNATHDSDGWYSATLTTTDTDTVGELILNVQTPATHLPVWMRWWVIEEAVYDAIFGASAALAMGSVTGAVGSVTGAVGSVTGAVASVTGAVGSVTGLTASDVGSIKTKTDFLPSATAGGAGGVFIAGSNAATSVTTALTANITGNVSGSVGSVTGAVGSVTGAVGSVTGAVGSVAGNVDGSVASVAAGGITASSIATDAIGAAELAADAVAEIADAVWDELTTDHITVNTFGQRLSVLETGTAVAAASTTITLDAGSSELADFYNGSIIVITAGTGAGQSRIISDYAVTTNIATVDAWITTPSTDSVYYIIPFGTIPGASAPTAGQVADAVWDEAQADHVAAGSFGVIASEIAAIPTTAMRGTDNAALATDLATAQLDLDTITGTAGAVIDVGTGAGQLAITSGAIDNVTLVATTTTNTDMVAAAPTAAANADAVWDEAQSGHVGAGTFGEIATEIALIPTTAMRGTDSAATAANLALAQTDLDTLTAGVALTAAGVDAIWDEERSGHVTQGTFGESFSVIASGTASGTPTTTTMVSDIGVTVDSQFNGRVIIFASDTTTAALRNQVTDITACTATTNTLTFTALTTTPVSGDTFIIV